jgi:adenylosuccinate synthase
LPELKKIFVNKNAIVSTPYDMLLNRDIEVSRGASKHGSCGVGINETVVRSNYDEPYFSLKITAEDIADAVTNRNLLLAKLKECNKHAFRRAEELNIVLSDTTLDVLEDDEWDDLWISGAIDVLNKHWELCDKPPVRQDYIFEGAQGLGLDQHHGTFPHVTRSSTGLANVVEIMKSLGLTDLQAIYMTRTYSTRHGEGPLPFNVGYMPYGMDRTNVPNEFQGQMRIGQLDVEGMSKRIYSDMDRAIKAYPELSLVANLGMTCLDHGFPTLEAGEDNARFTAAAMAMSGVYCSSGPFRDKVKFILTHQPGLLTPIEQLKKFEDLVRLP